MIDEALRAILVCPQDRGELLLGHRHEGTDLRMDYARDTLTNLVRVWKRPVNLLSRIDGKGKLLRYDGREHAEKGADYPDTSESRRDR